MIIAEWIKEQRKLLEAATPRPWERVGSSFESKNGDPVLSCECETSFGLTGATENLDIPKDNERLLLIAPTSLEKALAIIEIYEEALVMVDDQMQYYSCEIRDNPSSWNEVMDKVKEARTKAAQIVGGEG